ncbi:MAG TPA: alpha/beta hydrolase [Solirubrobacterales bacterium]|nr:alpha/beta hydrolase [Solirubrobacterales bacterium]
MSREQQAAIAARLREAAFEPGLSPDQLRSEFATRMAKVARPDGLAASEITLAGRPALTISPSSDPGNEGKGTILYFHGGAFVFGSPVTARPLTASLVRRTGAKAISLDYRLAPEHPFPAAIEDGVAAYRELLERGLAPESVVLAGDSAGGGLAVTTLVSARDAGLPMPAGIVAFSPVTDATSSGQSMQSRDGIDPIFTRELLASLYRHSVGDRDPSEPLLSPAIAADLRGLPPLLVQVGSHEVLLDDSTRLAARAAAADLDVTLEVTGGAPHVFQSFSGRLDEADRALDRAADFIAERWRACSRAATP